MPSIALLDGPASASGTKAHSLELSWDALTASLKEPVYTPCAPCPGKDCSHKAGKAWLPVRLKDSPCKRLDSNVAAVSTAVFDIDDPTDGQMQALAQKLDGLTYFVHQTHRGTGYRLLIAMCEEVPAPEWRGVWRAIVDQYQIPCDLTCLNESRLYYMPTRPEGSEFKTFEGVGEPLDWRSLDVSPAAVVKTFTAALTKDVGLTLNPTDPKNLRSGDVDLAELRQAVKSMRSTGSRAMLDKILAGQAFSKIGFRDIDMNKAVSVLAMAAIGKPYSVESIIALLHGSIRAMDCEPEGFDHWLDVAREKYLRAVGRRLERDARSDADKAALLRVLGQEPGKVLEGSSEEWRAGLRFTTGVDGEKAACALQEATRI